MSIAKLPGLKILIEEICRSHNLPQPTVEDALREALFKGYERYRRSKRASFSEEFTPEYFENVNVKLDLKEEGFQIIAVKTVSENVTDEDHQIALEQVQENDSDIPVGTELLIDVTPEKDDFGRMAAVQTKQVLQQKLKEQQRLMIQQEFNELEDTVLSAKVLRFERQSVIMTLQSAYGRPEVEAELPRYEQMNSDNYRANATFKVYLKKVRDGAYRGPQLIVSRADAGLVVYLFANEVPEIEEEIIDIVAISREANPNISKDGNNKSNSKITARTKIAVDTTEEEVDPVGACIGARGSRIQAVVNELKGEKIDVIRYAEDPASYIANALSPAKIDTVELIDEENRESLVIVPDNQFSLAIGTKGQNVRLAARLTGWKIDIKTKSQYYDDQEE